MKTNRNHLEIVAQKKNLPTTNEFFQMAVTFFMAVFTWIFLEQKTWVTRYNISMAFSPDHFLQLHQ